MLANARLLYRDLVKPLHCFAEDLQENKSVGQKIRAVCLC